MAKQKTNKQRISRKQQRLEAQAKTARMKQARIIGFIALALVIFGGIIAWRNTGRVPVEEVVAATPPNLDGPADAPVQVVEYGDFGCHSCRAWHNAGIKKQLQAVYGDQVSFEFRHFPVITAQSPKAAEAGQCAAEQGAFWQYHDYIYEQTPQNALGSSQLKEYASAIGLNQASFDSCLDSGKYQDYVGQDRRAAVEAGARGTPSFYVNGEAVFPSFEGMSEAIAAILAN
ncbi:MAG: thioredoxin domain-containing protein [Chloroflexi bacterium]|nr:thioredoxin domain-containing protein [Chloroflexota bacterium]